MPRLMLIACLAVLAAPIAAAAQQSPNPVQKQVAQPKTPPDKNDPNKLICTRVAVTGSNMKTRVCKTQAQMDKERADAQLFLEGAKMRPPVENIPTPR